MSLMQLFYFSSDKDQAPLTVRASNLMLDIIKVMTCS